MNTPPLRKLSHEEISANRVPKANIREAERLPIFAMLDNIRSLYNVGSIFRTSDGAMVKKVYLTGYTPRPPRKEIEKTALGATETVPWEYLKNPLEAVQQMKNDGVTVCVLEHTTRSIPYDTVSKKDFPIGLVVGNELTGVSSEIIAAADAAIEIPMFGVKQSLNAAVAYGIALFALVRIWKA
jgi:tRNA G18 (ribose-2'-O)-methylase SpoU